MFLELLRIFKIKDIQGKPYHPQSRGQVERKNQTIKKAVCKRKKCSCWTKFCDSCINTCKLIKLVNGLDTFLC